MASGFYNVGARGILDGTIDLTNDTIKVMLVDDTYTPDPDHDFVDDVSGDELSGTGYTSGFGSASRKTVSGKSFLTDNATDRAEFTGTVAAWTGLDAGTVGYAIFIKEVTTDADSIPIFYLDLGPTASNGGDFTITADSEGFAQASTV